MMIHSNVHVIGALTARSDTSNFPNVVLVRISGEVGTLCTVLLSVYSWTCLPIYFEIGSHLTDTEQKISWHVFFETRGI